MSDCCRFREVVLCVAGSTHERPSSADLALSAKIEAIHRRSRGVYGSPSIHAELADDYEIRVGRKRVARLMRAASFEANAAPMSSYAAGLQARVRSICRTQFYADGPDRLWSPTSPTFRLVGFCICHVSMCIRAHRGWSMETHLRTSYSGGPEHGDHAAHPSAVIHHSDKAANNQLRVRQRCREAGSSLYGICGRCYDNAMAKLLRHARAQCSAVVASKLRRKPRWLCSMIEGWYTSSTSFLARVRSPVNYERAHQDQIKKPELLPRSATAPAEKLHED